MGWFTSCSLDKAISPVSGFVCLSVVLAFPFNGCRQAVVEPESLNPALHMESVQPNPNNVLSVLVHATVSNASFIAAEFGTDSLLLQSTPPVPINSDSITLPVLGLFPNTNYFIRTCAITSLGITTRSGFQQCVTDSLPADIPRLSRTLSSDPSPGFVLLGFNSPANIRSYATIIDNEARVVWYRAFDGPVGDFQKQPNGRYTAHSSLGGNTPRFFEFDAAGTILREYQALGVDETDVHELRLVGSGYVLMGVDYRTSDLASLGGLMTAQVRGITVQDSRSSSQTFVWNTFDHFQVSDAAADIVLTSQIVNPWHGNAVDIDSDGNFIVSFRNMDEVTKINPHTGAVLWRLGGKHGQFMFKNDPLNGFSHQHGVRLLPNGNLIMFDNGNLHSPAASRAVEYVLDEANHTATLAWEYRPQPSLFAMFLGFAQRLSNGNTLVCFGNAKEIIEVDAMGMKRWEVEVLDPSRAPYRAFRINSLY